MNLDETRENTLTDKELIAPELPQQRDPKNAQLKSGWYKVAASVDISQLEAIQIDDFPTQIVIWRGEDKKLRALDLYCKHMGASLACGEVDENGIRCPFHAWRWSGDGLCNEVPYAKRIPPKAITRSWEVNELDGFIYVWFDRQGKSADLNGEWIDEFSF